MPSKSMSPRHPSRGGYAKGEETRARIIIAALHVFGEEGFDNASTRRIAADAGVNSPALQYHFGSKEGLHGACTQFIIDRLMTMVAPALRQAHDINQPIARIQTIENVCSLLDAMVDGAVAAGTQGWSRVLTQNRVHGAEEAIAMLRQTVCAPITLAVVHLVALATHRDPTDEVLQIKAASIMGQITAFLTDWGGALESPTAHESSAQRLQTIKTVVRLHTFAILADSA